MLTTLILRGITAITGITTSHNVCWNVLSTALTHFVESSSYGAVRIFRPIAGRRKEDGYMAIRVACRLAGAIFEVTRPFVYEQCGQRIKT